MDLDSDRGIFIINLFRSIIMKMVYKDKYHHVDGNMSDSNVGARKNKNIRNHIFVINGIINEVINKKNLAIDIDILDYRDIKENAWKRIGEKKFSHEEHSERLEKEEKKVKRENVKERMKQLEEGRKSAEDKEKERRSKFMEDWKRKVERKKKQEKVGKVGRIAGRRGGFYKRKFGGLV